MNAQVNGRKIFFFGALGGLLFGYDTGVISGAILFIKKDLNLISWTEGVVVSSILLGSMSGAAISRGLSDRLGRRQEGRRAAPLWSLGALGPALSANT